MKPASFDYHTPSTLDEALALLAEHGSDAKPLAGGQSLIPAMNFRLATPGVLVDLNRIDALSYVTEDAGGLRIGGLSRHRTLERSPVVATHAPLVTAAMPFVGHAAIRTRGTIGGSLAHADPSAELPAVMLALGASIVVQSQTGTRAIAADDFFTGLFATTLESGELVVRIDLPSQVAGTRVAFDELARRHGDFALAGAAVAVTIAPDGVCTAARIALLGVGDRPMRAMQAERALVGECPSAELLRAAAEASAQTDIDPTSDIHASSSYRRRLAAVLMRRVLERACSNPEAA